MGISKQIVHKQKVWTCPGCNYINLFYKKSCGHFNAWYQCMEQQPQGKAEEPELIAPTKMEKHNNQIEEKYKKGKAKYSMDCNIPKPQRTSNTARASCFQHNNKSPSRNQIYDLRAKCNCKKRGHTVYLDYLCPAGRYCRDGNW